MVKHIPKTDTYLIFIGLVNIIYEYMDQKRLDHTCDIDILTTETLL